MSVPDAAAIVAQPADPIRIERLTISAFRAFPHPVAIGLGGKNLLVYGENGSGKSSIFHALKNFFALSPAPFESLRNVRNPNAEQDFRVEVEFKNDPAHAIWSRAGHPGHGWPAADPRVTETALRKACLDYRALLDTNYLHGQERPNLFKIAVEHLLADYPVVVEGGVAKTISQLWRAIDQARPVKWTKSKEPVNEACAAFNVAFRSALDAVIPRMQSLLEAIPKLGVELAPFAFSGVTYHDSYRIDERRIDGQKLFPEISFNGHATEKPQNFLNEARLSAIALAMYLGGRLASVPIDGAGRLKLLVLDDVLIGLDHDNRQPILQLIQAHFVDWQVVILTHDRVWFDMAKAFFAASQEWTWAEIRADGNNGSATPTIKQDQLDLADAALADAESLLANHLSAAANSTRRAAEMAIQNFSDKRRIEVPYKRDARDIGPFLLLDRIDMWIFAKLQDRAPLQAISSSLRAFLNAALNPQSHANAPNPSSLEVQSAIAAVRALKASQIR